MNPHVSLNWIEIAFPVVMTVLVGVQLLRRGPFREELLGRIGLIAIILALTGTSVANIFYQRVVNVRAWPTVGKAIARGPSRAAWDAAHSPSRSRSTTEAPSA
jgi:hypothetical protein